MQSLRRRRPVVRRAQIDRGLRSRWEAKRGGLVDRGQVVAEKIPFRAGPHLRVGGQTARALLSSRFIDRRHRVDLFGGIPHATPTQVAPAGVRRQCPSAPH